MRIGQLIEREKLHTGLYAASAPAKKNNDNSSRNTGAKSGGSAKQPSSGAKTAAAPGAKPTPNKAGAGLPKGKSPISPNHQKLHAMARTHGFKHVGMSVYQHPTAGLTLSVGPSGWSLSDGTQGTDWEDLQTHLEKSFGLPMQDPNAIDPMTGQPMGAQPAGGGRSMGTQPGGTGQRRSQPGMGGQPAGGGPKQKNPNSFQSGFMGQ
jgi:hypothetical protein